MGLGLALSAWMLATPPPSSIGLWARHGLFPVLAAGFAFYAVLRLAPRKRDLVLPSIALPLFALPLAGLWSAGLSEDGVIGGLLPWYDGSAYHAEAQRLLEGEPLSGAVSRPWSVGLTAILLRVSGWDLRVTTALIWALPALTSILFARVVTALLGARAGALGLLLLFSFARPSSGTLLTENLGLALGALGFGALACTTLSPRVPALALSVVAAAFVARPGAMLVLPLLVAAFALGGEGALRRLAIAGVAASAPFLLGATLGRLLGSPLSGLLDPHFSYSFYGLAAGGTGWQSALGDHSELRLLSEPALSRRVMDLALEHARSHPMDLLNGALRAWADFFSVRGRGAFGFVGGQDVALPVTAVLRGGLWLLAIRGGLRCFRGNPAIPRWLFWAAVGASLSVPFAPPSDAAMRPYAATVPLLALLVGLGVAGSPGQSRIAAGACIEAPPSLASLQQTSSLALVGVAVLAIVFAGALFLRGSAAASPTPAPAACPEGLEPVLVRLAPGSAIRLVVENASTHARGPLSVGVGRFREGLRNFAPADVRQTLRTLVPGDALANPYVLGGGHTALVVIPSRLVPPAAARVTLCAVASQTPGGWLVLRASESRVFP